MPNKPPEIDAPVVPARGKGRPKLGETAKIDEAIRAAGLKILLEQGEGATLNAVAQAAGLSRRSVYARYPNKAQLFVEIVIGLMDNSGTLQFEDSGSADDRLYNCILAALETISHPFTAQLQRLLNASPVYLDSLQSRLLAASSRVFLEPLHRILEDGVRSGEFAISDIDAATRMIVNILDARIVSFDPADRVPATSADRARQARSLTDFLTRGFHPRKN